MRIVVRLAVLAAVLALSVGAVAPVAAAPSPALPPPPGTILGTHTVQQGQTLDCIGRAYSVDPNAIAQFNGTSSPAVGQKLNIPAVPGYNTTVPACLAQFTVPAGWPPPPPTTIFGQHTVKQGEWIYCIARAYKVNPMAIAQASGIPGPYGPAGWCGGCSGWQGSCGGCGGWQPAPCGWGWCGGWSPWNFVYPGQVLQIPAAPWWGYNNPAGPTCAAQSTVVLPAGW